MGQFLAFYNKQPITNQSQQLIDYPIGSIFYFDEPLLWMVHVGDQNLKALKVHNVPEEVQTWVLIHGNLEK